MKGRRPRPLDEGRAGRTGPKQIGTPADGLGYSGEAALWQALRGLFFDESLTFSGLLAPLRHGHVEKAHLHPLAPTPAIER